MNYEKIYELFVADRKTKLISGYSENHHIKPKSFGGSNLPENMIRLSARDHFFAHELLAKIYGGNMNIAIWRMANRKSPTGSRITISSRQYEKIRSNWAREMSVRNKGKKRPVSVSEKISKALKGRVMNQQWRDNMSKSRIGKKGKPRTAERKEKDSQLKIGSKNPAYGKPSSAKQKESVRIANTGIKSKFYNHTVYKFIHKNGEKIECTQNALKAMFRVNSGNLSALCLGKRNHVGGWMLQK